MMSRHSHAPKPAHTAATTAKPTLSTVLPLHPTTDVNKLVVNVRKSELKRLGYRDLEHWLSCPDHVYVGRDMTKYVPGAVGSKWGNPFKEADGDISERLYLYEQKVRNTTALWDSLLELKDKHLGCWCRRSDWKVGDPEECHCDVLLRLIPERLDESTDASVGAGAGTFVTSTQPAATHAPVHTYPTTKDGSWASKAAPRLPIKAAGLPTARTAKVCLSDDDFPPLGR